jgi:hypothetical protein
VVQCVALSTQITDNPIAIPNYASLLRQKTCSAVFNNLQHQTSILHLQLFLFLPLSTHKGIYLLNTKQNTGLQHEPA